VQKRVLLEKINQRKNKAYCFYISVISVGVCTQSFYSASSFLLFEAFVFRPFGDGGLASMTFSFKSGGNQQGEFFDSGAAIGVLSTVFLRDNSEHTVFIRASAEPA